MLKSLLKVLLKKRDRETPKTPDKECPASSFARDAQVLNVRM